RTVRVREHGNCFCLRDELAQQLQSLRPQLTGQESHAGDVATRPIEAGDEAIPDRVAPAHEHDRHGGVAAFAASAALVFPTMTATCRLIKSATRLGNRSSWSFAERYSTATFWPSTKPASFRPLRKPVTRWAASAFEVLRRNPITGIAVCCARAASGHAVAEPINPLMKSRRRIAFLKAATTPTRTP